MNENGLVLEEAPQTLGEDVVYTAARAAHGDGTSGVFDHGGELQAGELTALIGVEDLGAADALQGTRQGIGA